MMMLRLLVLSVSGLTLCHAIFFGMGGGGGGGCCCGCGTPQPPSCGCAPACPPAPACPVCPPPQPCPAPPAAYCPQVQPVYVQSSGGCGGGGCGGGGGGGCGGGGCGGGGGGCSGGGCGGGGGGCGGGGGGCGGGGGGGYASSGGSSGGGGFVRSPVSLPAPAAGYAGPPPPPPSSGGYSSPAASNSGFSGGSSTGGGYSSGASSSSGGGGYSSGSSTGGGYPGGAAAAGATAAQVDEATESDGSEPPVDQVFHSPKEPCVQQVKYVMLRSRKVPGTEATELVEEELEQVANPTHVEATANPLDAQLGEEIAAQEQAATEDSGDEESASSGDFKARAAKTAVTDEKCNSKILQKLVLSNIAANDALASKKAIHENALQQFPDSSVDVICSTTGFTYLVSTTEHCEAQKDGVICFVYKRPL